MVTIGGKKVGCNIAISNKVAIVTIVEVLESTRFSVMFNDRIADFSMSIEFQIILARSSEGDYDFS